MCPHCGLILCSLQLPHLPCPSCNDLLLNPVSRERVKKKLQEEIKDVLAKEQAERDRTQAEKRQLLEAESGGGMFPTLGGVQVKPEKETKTRRVLTIGGSKTAPAKGKAKPSSGTSTPILTTYRPKIPLSQAAQDALLDREERKKLGRVERPFCFDLEPYEAREERQRKVRLNEEWKRREGRLWADMEFASMGMEIEYVFPAQAVAAAAAVEEPSVMKPVVPGAEVKVPKAKPSRTKKKAAKANPEQRGAEALGPSQNVASVEGPQEPK
ncbi:hypothetical protein QFC22_004181 [Naganishia vaughanmartiniae]|uniref:Uncharacterized protein n=1 Tax=Naganishia vaughanmartiniae TaxID=1424756 RepID=A0ACC2X2K7_9TREE|nr:hypothetical protein QFC22_004181 [Naganishia vaughanmartiniae]